MNYSWFDIFIYLISIFIFALMILFFAWLIDKLFLNFGQKINKSKNNNKTKDSLTNDK